MLFEEEVCGFLADNDMECRMEQAESFTVLAAMDSNVVTVPVPVRSAAPEDADMENRRLRTVLENIDPSRKAVVLPEDLWRSRGAMMRARLLAQHGLFRSVFARNTSARRITADIAAGFFGQCHTYGDAASRYRYGLFTKDGEMVAAASFSSGRTWQKSGRRIHSHEWVRYASLPDVRVVGGMGKILKFFIGDVCPDDVMSYADLEWTDGKVYEKLGFEEDGFREPVLFAVDVETWKRRPVKCSAEAGTEAGTFFHKNLGSRKYRLKLYGTDENSLLPNY